MMMRRYWMAGLALVLSTVGAASAAHAASFDARRSADIAAFVTSHGASGALKKADDGKLYFDGKAGNTFFDVHFQTCDDARTYCKTMLLGASWDSKKLTVDQINGWNRWTLFCPAYLDKDNAPNIWYSIAVTSNTNEDDLATPLSTWMDCLHDFDSFVDGPEDFLKNHA
jgi:hypothetical protein